MDDITDEALLKRAKAGDSLAFRSLVERYEPAVAATAAGMLGRGADAEDVAQETFIRFYRSMEAFRGDSALKTYLTRIAINLSLSALKKRKRIWTRFPSRDRNEARWYDPAGEPPDTALEDERRRRVREAIDGLDEKHRAVVVLRMMEGCSTRETAEILEVPEGTVLSRLARAMKRLEEALDSYMDDDEH